MEIRRLVGRDAACYRSLMLDGYGRHPDAFTATVAERGPLPMAWWANRIEQEFVVGAWQATRLVGVAGLVAESRPKTRHKATLYGMYVDPAFARQGIGARLVDAVLDEAVRKASLRVVQLTVTEGNRPAQALYERCGFVPFGIEPHAIAMDGRHLSKVHMWIDLATRAEPVRGRDAATSHA
jgi:ribosomal protein S18 acetylase RimI-like enzyme